MKRILVILILSANIVCAQNWVPLGAGLKGGITEGRVLYSDSISGKLFVGGSFTRADNHYAYGIAAWTGLNWDTLNGGVGCCYSNPSFVGGIITTISSYQNQLYAGGGFTYLYGSPYTTIVNGFTRWNGTSWDSINIAFHQNGGRPFYFCEYNNLLYCVGNFDSAGAYYSPHIVKWDGVNWIPISIPSNLFTNGFEKCLVFQNALYFPNVLDTTTGISYAFLKWDGTTWSVTGANFGGLVHALAVYNNEIYIGGSNFVGVPGSNIVKFDGTNFYSVGNDVNATVWNFKVIENKLFAVGVFDHAGGIPASNIAIWDGNGWSAFSNDTFYSGGINDIAVFNNELYVTGAFYKINSDSIWSIAKYNGWYLGEKEFNKKSGASVYPNPANNIININLTVIPTREEFLIITDVLGNNIYQQTLLKMNNSIDVSKWSNGVYFYEITNNKEIFRGRFVKV